VCFYIPSNFGVNDTKHTGFSEEWHISKTKQSPYMYSPPPNTHTHTCVHPHTHLHIYMNAHIAET